MVQEEEGKPGQALLRKAAHITQHPRFYGHRHDVCRAHQLFAGAALLQRYASYLHCMHASASKDKVLRATYHALSRPSPLRPALVMPCPFRGLPYPDQLCLFLTVVEYPLHKTLRDCPAQAHTLSALVNSPALACYTGFSVGAMLAY